MTERKHKSALLAIDQPLKFGMSAFLAIATIVVSLSVAFIVNGSFFETVRIIDLETWGGITWPQFMSGEVWRIVSAQLVHVRIPHMYFNAASLLLIGIFVESVTSRWVVLGVWLIAGGAATLISPILIEPPYNVGTGASQAVLALGGFGLALLLFARRRTPFAIAVTFLATVPPFLIDFAFAGYAKPGHLAGLFLGFMLGIGWVLLQKGKSARRDAQNL